MLMKRLIVFVLFLLLINIVHATDCNSCSDCTSKAIAGASLTLTQNLSINNTDCVVITQPNVTIDCQGYKINGTGATDGCEYMVGIKAENVYGIHIKNCIVDGFCHGIRLQDSNHSVVENNTVLNNTYIGIILGGHGENITVKNNNMFYTLHTGFSLQDYSNCLIEGNNASLSTLGSGFDIGMGGDTYNILFRNNYAYNNNFRVLTLYMCHNSSFYNNTLAGSENGCILL